MDNSSEKNSSSTTVSAGGSASHTGADWFWTDERHVHFLNSIEATFIRTMYQSDAAAGRTLPLDRQLPDSFESTLDLGKERPTKHSYSDAANYSSVVRTHKKQHKRLTSGRHDQVVPQLNSRLEESNLVSKRSKNSTVDA